MTTGVDETDGLQPRLNLRNFTIALFVVIILCVLVSIGSYVSTRPAWLLTATNTPEGVQIEIYKEGNDEPIYETLLEGHSIARNLQRVSRQELPSEIGTTTFYDDTLRPGVWTLVIDGAQLDITPSQLVLPDGTSIAPRE